jgi:hypothetical protein
VVGYETTAVFSKSESGPARTSGRGIEKRDRVMIVLMAGLRVSFPPQEKRRQKFPPWLTKRFYVRCAQGKTKHAAPGAFCAPHLGSTLLSMSDVTPAPACLKKMFPGLTEAEYASLDAWYAGYAALILRMYERITGDPGAYADFLALTSQLPRPTMTGKVDSPKQTDNS